MVANMKSVDKGMWTDVDILPHPLSLSDSLTCGYSTPYISY